MSDFYATHLGPHRFHNNNDFMYLPPSDPSIQKITEKEKVCSCPLCHGDGGGGNLNALLRLENSLLTK